MVNAWVKGMGVGKAVSGGEGNGRLCKDCVGVKEGITWGGLHRSEGWSAHVRGEG